MPTQIRGQFYFHGDTVHPVFVGEDGQKYEISFVHGFSELKMSALLGYTVVVTAHKISRAGFIFPTHHMEISDARLAEVSAMPKNETPAEKLLKALTAPPMATVSDGKNEPIEVYRSDEGSITLQQTIKTGDPEDEDPAILVVTRGMAPQLIKALQEWMREVQ